MTDEKQDDWSQWVQFAVYAYNSARHTTVALTPSELMMGRRLRPPNELMRRMERTEAGDLMEHHQRLVRGLARSHDSAEQARRNEQERQARYYNRRTRQRRTFSVGDRVWVFNPPRGQKATKFVHQWMGPMRIVEPAGYENWLLEHEDKVGPPETIIAHTSFLVSYHYPTALLPQQAADLVEQLDDEDQRATRNDVEAKRAAVRAAAAPRERTATTGAKRRRAEATARTNAAGTSNDGLVELQRRRRRNRVGQYPLEYELRPTGERSWWRNDDERLWTTKDGRPKTRWVSVNEYDALQRAGRVVEDPWNEEVV